jgi:phage shock protein A
MARVAKLVNADLNAVLDRIEEPEALLKQAIRDMEEEIAREAQRIKWTQGEIGTLAARTAAARKTLGDLEAKLDLCIAAGNDELGRKLTRRKLQTQLLAQRLDEKTEALDKTVAEQAACLAEHKDQLEGMLQKAELLTATPAACTEGAGDADFALGDDEVEIAFLREKAARSGS